ncbi:hypothetical protein K432DRAFT_286526, partial [Lepidopterella palustris CBS 459.81]
LQTLITHPTYQHRGVGTLLLTWGLDRSQKDQLPIYLESTVDASSFYEGFGFSVVDELSLTPGDVRPSQIGRHEVYRELCMFKK